MSGPQYPLPSSVQQRYCYPRGDSKEYATQMGGAMWTVYNKDGEEDLNYRLLHVYFSEKRAVNKKQANNVTTSSKEQVTNVSVRNVEGKGTLDAFSAPSTFVPVSPLCLSPMLSFDHGTSLELSLQRILSPQLYPSNRYSNMQKLVCLPKVEDSVVRMSAPIWDCRLVAAYHSTIARCDGNVSPESRTFRSPHRHSFDPLRPGSNFYSSPPLSAQQQTARLPVDEDEIAMLEFEAWWTDPIPVYLSPRGAAKDIQTKDELAEGFATKLELIHANLLEKIREAPEVERTHLASVLSSWAECIAKAPGSANAIQRRYQISLKEGTV